MTPQTRSVVAHATEVIDFSRLVLQRNFDEMMSACERSERIPVDARVRYRHTSSTMVDRCVDVVDQLMTASGGAGIFLTNPISRFFYDIHAARAHYANNPDKPAANLGANLLGLPNTDFFL